MSSSAYSNDDASQKLVINTPAGLVGLDKCMEIVKSDLARVEKDKNEAAARVYRGVLAAFRALQRAGSEGVFYAQLQMTAAQSAGEPPLSRSDQAEVMRLVRSHVEGIRGFEQQRRPIRPTGPIAPITRPQQAHSTARKRLENTKLKGRGSR